MIYYYGFERGQSYKPHNAERARRTMHRHRKRLAKKKRKGCR